LREDLQPIEEAKAFGRLMDMNGWNAKQLAAAIHVCPAKVSRSLALLRLPEDVRAQVASGRLSSRAAYEISRVTDKAACRRLAVQAVAGKWTHDQAAKAVRTRRGKRRRRAGQFKLTFATESGWKITASHTGNTTYHDLRAAIAEVMDEIDARIAGNVGLY
jgi:ParB family chromosome partitioning protein